MRVSDQQLTDRSNLWIQRAREAAAQAREQVQSGRRVTKPSDDPLASAFAVRESVAVARDEAARQNVGEGRSFAEATEAALDGVGGILIRLRELTIQASNETLSAADREAVSREVAALREQVAALASSEARGRYLFGGYLDAVPPFDAAGNYLGSPDVREVEVAPGVRVATGLPGDRVFGTAGGGVDLFRTIDDLTAALQADDVDGVRASLDGLDAATSQVADARAELGGMIDAFRTASSVLERTRDEALTRRADLVDSSVDEILDLAQAERAVETAAALAARLPLSGLLGG